MMGTRETPNKSTSIRLSIPSFFSLVFKIVQFASFPLQYVLCMYIGDLYSLYKNTYFPMIRYFSILQYVFFCAKVEIFDFWGVFYI